LDVAIGAFSLPLDEEAVYGACVMNISRTRLSALGHFSLREKAPALNVSTTAFLPPETGRPGDLLRVNPGQPGRILRGPVEGIVARTTAYFVGDHLYFI